MRVSTAILQIVAVSSTLIGLTALASCASPDPAQSSSPEVSIDHQAQVWLCGAVISTGRAVPSIVHAYLQDASPVEHSSMSGNIYLQLTADCQKGTDYSVVPSENAEVVQRINDSSGTTVFLVLKPIAKEFDVRFGDASGHPGKVSVRLKDGA